MFLSIQSVQGGGTVIGEVPCVLHVPCCHVIRDGPQWWRLWEACRDVPLNNDLISDSRIASGHFSETLSGDYFHCYNKNWERHTLKKSLSYLGADGGPYWSSSPVWRLSYRSLSGSTLRPRGQNFYTRRRGPPQWFLKTTIWIVCFMHLEIQSNLLRISWVAQLSVNIFITF